MADAKTATQVPAANAAGAPQNPNVPASSFPQTTPPSPSHQPSAADNAMDTANDSQSTMEPFEKMTPEERAKILDELRTKVMNATEDTDQFREDKDNLVILQHLVNLDQMKTIQEQNERMNQLSAQLEKTENGALELTENSISSMIRDEALAPAFNANGMNVEKVKSVFDTIRRCVPRESKSEVNNLLGSLIAAGFEHQESVDFQTQRIDQQLAMPARPFRNNLRGLGRFTPYAGQPRRPQLTDRYENIKSVARTSEASRQMASSSSSECSASSSSSSSGSAPTTDWRARLSKPVHDPTGKLIVTNKYRNQAQM